MTDQTVTIKFRLWIPGDEEEPAQMIDGDGLAFEEYAPLTDLLSREHVMQWTGFVDERGVEIYRGDIVSYWDDLDGDPDRSEGMGDVVWSQDLGGWTVTGEDGYMLGELVEGWHVWVIGNRYANPELIEGDE